MKRFTNDRVVGWEAKSSNMSKKDRREQLLTQRVHLLGRLKKYKKDMKALKQLDGDYEYSSEHLANMVGNCYMQMDILNGELDAVNKELK